MTTAEILKQALNGLCPNCNNNLEIDKNFQSVNIEMFYCHLCEIVATTGIYSCTINYHEYSAEVDLKNKETICLKGDYPFTIDGIPTALDIKSVLNFIAIGKTFS